MQPQSPFDRVSGFGQNAHAPAPNPYAQTPPCSPSDQCPRQAGINSASTANSFGRSTDLPPDANLRSPDRRDTHHYTPPPEAADTRRVGASPSGDTAIYQVVFEHLPEAIALITSDGEWIDANRGFCELVGLPKFELQATPLTAFFPPNTPLLHHLQTATADHLSGMVWLHRADGAAQWVEYELWLHACPHHHRLLLRDPPGDSVNEPLSQLSADGYKRLLSEVNAAISRLWVYADRTWQADYISAGCQAVFGFAAAELAAAPEIWRSRVVPEDWDDSILPSFQRIFAGADGTINYRFRHRDGKVRLISCNFRSRWDEGHNCWSVTLVETCILLAPPPCLPPSTDSEETAAIAPLLAIAGQADCILTYLSRIILSSLDLDVLFHTVSMELVRLLQVDRVEITRYRPWQSDWQVVTNFGRDEQCRDRTGFTMPDANNPFAAALRRLEAVQINGATAEASDSIADRRQQFPGTWLLVPLHVPVEVNGVRSHQLWGYLGFNCYQSCHRWQASEIHLIRQVAHQLAIGIQKAELHTALKQFNDQLEQEVTTRTQQLHAALKLELLLRRITEKIRNSLDETQIIQTIVEQLTQELGISGCDIAIYDYDAETTTIHSGYATDPQLPPLSHNQMLLDRDFIQQYQLGAVVLHCPIGLRLRAITSGYEVLSCAIADDQQVLGDLWMFRRCEAGSFGPAEVRVMQQVANQCAIALRQSRLYQNSQHQIRELERVNQLKDDFLSTVSHELRTPISNINMATQMLEVLLFGSQSSNSLPLAAQTTEQAFVLTPEAAQRSYRYFQILQDECKREIALINDLLDLSRLDAQSEPLFLTTINLSDWLRHLAEPFMARVQDCHCALELHLPANLQFSTDLKFLERLLSELLHNACKYTPAGETIALAATLMPTGDCEIIVSNTGVEIAPAEQARIFDKFYRIPSSDPWKHEGTGLGLALVSRLADRLGGVVTLRSQHNLTEFIVTIPHLPPPPDTQPPA